MMCFTICSDKSCPVNGKDHMKILHTYIVKDLIDPSLQERRIYRKHGNFSCGGKPRAKSNGVFFRYSDIKEPFGTADGKGG